MKAAEMRQMGQEVLEQELEARRRELLETRCQVALGEDVRPHHVGDLKRDIARMLTVLGEKKRESATTGESS